MSSQTNVPAQVDRVEPPFWWAGMKHRTLQLLVHGRDIGKSRPQIDYPGVSCTSVHTTENPNYLFIDLDLSQEVRPGSFEIRFVSGGKILGSYEYELRQREDGSADRRGFDNSDVIYLLMPDRFSNGDPANDRVEGMHEGLNRKNHYGRHGGDLRGISNHLDYIAGMGFTALWLNPVLENNQKQSSYHGYAITDFYRIDPRFGDNGQYRELCLAARSKGVKMIMDMVFNHCGSEHWWMKDMPMAGWINFYPDYITTNHRRTVNQDPYSSAYDRKLMTEGWFVPSMPDLNLANPFMANYMIQNGIWWIEYSSLAGIRMDTYPYPDKHGMAEWNRRVLLEYPNFNQVGEEWTSNPAIVSYWQRGQANRDGYEPGMPSMMDFPLQTALFEALTEKESHNTGWAKLYEALANDFLYPDPYNLTIFPDNHDMSRFYMQLGMDTGLYKLGIAYILTTRGIPQIYYGSEILMTHTEGDDHGRIRKDFPGGWEGDSVNAFTGKGLGRKEANMQKFFRLLLNWRKENPIVHTGKLMHFAPDKGIYVFFRYNDRQRIMVVLNKNRTRQNLDLGRFAEMLTGYRTGKDVISGKTYKLGKEIEVPGKHPLILELK